MIFPDELYRYAEETERPTTSQATDLSSSKIEKSALQKKLPSVIKAKNLKFWDPEEDSKVRHNV